VKKAWHRKVFISGGESVAGVNLEAASVVAMA
jgi:hypothetical protein